MKGEQKLDALDRSILKRLQDDATVSYKELASEIGAPESTIYDRTKKLKAQKVIKTVVPVLDGEKVGISTTAYILVSLDKISDMRKIAEQIAKLAEVLEVHEITGEWDLLVKVKVKTVKALRDLEVEKIGTVKGVHTLHSLICVGTIKEDIRLPI